MGVMVNDVIALVGQFVLVVLHDLWPFVAVCPVLTQIRRMLGCVDDFIAYAAWCGLRVIMEDVGTQQFPCRKPSCLTMTDLAL